MKLVVWLLWALEGSTAPKVHSTGLMFVSLCTAFAADATHADYCDDEKDDNHEENNIANQVMVVVDERHRESRFVTDR